MYREIYGRSCAQATVAQATAAQGEVFALKRYNGMPQTLKGLFAMAVCLNAGAVAAGRHDALCPNFAKATFIGGILEARNFSTASRTTVCPVFPL
ncbi:MAG: hypothetical protein BCS36_05095 [Desulfovibrio sp. MES5]|uniref:hypothetical protein n=1 Tax=Desulfovibrio sp. MES5 TaxID=1899016 RepID=UPI000B9C9778|nr:hypothetical protein [Desulfovibrio sp. MES5]OXS28707.1 MAG: hypothetical protein BCS36_05095 [Desulfovibrio sp. MES5]